MKSAQIQSEAPTKSFLGAAQKDLAAVKAHYRLIDQPADSAVTPENILAPHRQRTLGKDVPKLFETVREEAAQARLEIHVVEWR